jgi:hypothetical protein
MDFSLTERQAQWRDRVRAFIDQHVVPAIPQYQAQTRKEGAERWQVIPIV